MKDNRRRGREQGDPPAHLDRITTLKKVIFCVNCHAHQVFTVNQDGDFECISCGRSPL